MPASNTDKFKALALSLFVESAKIGLKRERIQSSDMMGDNIRALCTSHNVNFENFCTNYELTANDLATPLRSRISLGLTFKLRRIADALETSDHKLLHEKIEVPEKSVTAPPASTSSGNLTTSGRLIPDSVG
ncbi:MAG: hypothetical protein ACT4OY_04045 [Alphaproteobacteria bacterium]